MNIANQHKRKILVTSALPYANGPIHLGHLVEYIQTDIWVRFQKLNGNEVYYFCADDTHGTAIVISAQKQNITPEELIQRIYHEHYQDLTSFEIEFDNYYTTNSQENQFLSETIYLKAKEKGKIYKKNVKQLFCERDKMFLPDRFVKGKCPKCGADEQYGDSCEVCGSSYRPDDLIQPKCAICGNVPIQKEEEHIFFQLSNFQDYLQSWLTKRVDESIKNKMYEWIKMGLKDWDISRDGPYFGFLIPGEKNKYFYVWLDAPIGYIASSLNYFKKKKQEELFDKFWKEQYENETEVYHFIGKDIVYFHTLFWPALLHSTNFRTPTRVFVHGFLTINGEKMSKSRGTFVKARSYLKHLDPMALRYYYASRLSNSIDDIDLSIQDFILKYNNSVVGNFTNLFSRSAKLMEKLNYELSSDISPEGKDMIQKILQRKNEIIQNYENRNFHKVVMSIEEIGFEINKYISDQAPWNTIKTDPETARQTLTDVLNASWLMTIYLKPILPFYCKGVEEFLNVPLEYKTDFSFLKEKVEEQKFLPSRHKLHTYRILAVRIQKDQVDRMFLEEQMEQKYSAEKEKKEDKRGSNSITIEDFSKVEIKVGKIIAANYVEGSDKLLYIQIDVGEEKPRNVFAGIKKSYKPEEIIGLKVIAITNLAPRKMKFGISEAMLLAAGEEGDLTLFVPHKDIAIGSRLK